MIYYTVFPVFFSVKTYHNYNLFQVANCGHIKNMFFRLILLFLKKAQPLTKEA